MIEINLLPDESKSKIAASAKAAGLNRLLYAVPLLVAVFLALHILFLAVFAVRSYQLSLLNNKWVSLKPQREALDVARKDFDLASQDNRVAQQLSSGRISWAVKLNQLSLDLAPGIWFTQLSLSPKECLLRGSVVSLHKEEMGLVNRFIENLKKDKAFIFGLSNIELTSVQMRDIGGHSVVDFMLLMKTSQASAAQAAKAAAQP